jgi:murein DD-endopeptidase MepM/ murein hydrolase activator NlpD
VTRFDFPSFNFAGGNNATTGSIAGSSAPPPPRQYDDYSAGPPRGAGDAGRYSPPPQPYGAADRSARRDNLAPPRDYAPADEEPAVRPKAVAGAGGRTIEVQEGDSLYGIAKRYGVSISALMDANGLRGGSIKPGQQLVLPSGTPYGRGVQRSGVGRGVDSPPPSPPPAAAPAPIAARPPPGWTGSYTMKSGDSLYGIARAHKVSLAELQRVNRITEPTRVRVGHALIVPGGIEPIADRAPPSGRHQAAPTPRILNRLDEPLAPPSPPTARRGDVSSDVTAPDAEPASMRFRWPVRGRIVANYGRRPDGTHNDGINLAVPQGTDVHAAEGGKVAYAGSELKAYGNLILIRHANGWVTAYAHADQILVRRDDVVRRGQVIAKAGRTGTVDQPQLHFELRQGSKPVDPMPHMDK